MSPKNQLEDHFAGAVRKAIALDGRSIDAVGRAAGFSRGYLSQLLRGRQDLKIKHVERILQALGIDPPALLRQVAEGFEEQGSTVAGNLPASKLVLEKGRSQWVGRRTPLSQSRGLLGLRQEAESLDLREVIRTILLEELPKELLGDVSGQQVSSKRASTAGRSENAKLGYSRELDELRPLLGVDKEEFDVALAAAGAGTVVEPARYPLESVRRRRGLTRGQLEDEVKEARRWFRFLQRRVPEGDWCTKVQGAYKWYGGPVFGTVVLEEARACFPEDVGRALLLADVALASCRKVKSRAPDPQVLIPALAVRGNALRALGRLTEADASLREATKLLDSSELNDLLIGAEVHSFLGSLRRDQGRLEEAAHHLHRSADLYRVLGREERTARILLKLSLVHYLDHSFERAVAATEAALQMLEGQSEEWLRAYARYNLAHHLHAAGETDRAEAELEAHQDLLASAGDEVAQHVVWLQGRIAWSRRNLSAAARRFREARKRARALGLRYEEGLIALELSLVELAGGRTDRAQATAEEALKIFARQEEVERESRAALELLEAAARREELDRQLLQRAVAALEQARHGRRTPTSGPR